MDSIVEKIIGLIKEVKRKDIDPKLITWIEDRYGPWDDRDFISDDGDTYFKTDADYESEGGGISHKIVKLPSFSVLIKQLKATRDAANELVKGESVRDDEILRDISNELKREFNRFRTHLRKEYPAFYAQLKSQLTKEELEEMSTTGGGAGAASFTPGTGMAYATPYAFRRPKKKQKPIPENLKEDIDLNSYGYSLVPKNKAGNYVQKGSKLDVKQLFEDQKDFQLKRVAAFDVIEQELNDIYKMLSNAKNETSEYYNDNPSSYTVIKPTDLVLDYIKDIKDLLKGE